MITQFLKTMYAIFNIFVRLIDLIIINLVRIIESPITILRNFLYNHAFIVGLFSGFVATIVSLKMIYCTDTPFAQVFCQFLDLFINKMDEFLCYSPPESLKPTRIDMWKPWTVFLIQLIIIYKIYR